MNDSTVAGPRSLLAADMIGPAGTASRSRAGARLWPSLSPVMLARVLVLCAVVASTAYWSAASLARWRNFEAGAFDLGLFDQLLWNTAHGRFFETSFLPYNYLGEHFSPVLLAFTPAYYLGAGPGFLLVAQAVLASVAAVLLFEGARALRLPLPVGIAVTLAYLLNPYLHWALLYDFHPETAIALPAFAAIWAAAAGRYRWAAGAALSVLLFKEDAVFVAFALAAAMWVLGGRREAWAVTGASAVFALAVILIVMPAMRDGNPQELTDRYPMLFGGETGLRSLAWLVGHPAGVAREALSPTHLGVMARFLCVGALAGLAAPWSVLLTVVAMQVPVLSSHPQQAALQLHYAVELVPLAIMASLFGMRRLGRLPSSVLAAVVVAPALLGAVVIGPVGLGTGGVASPEARREAVREALSLVPADAVVAAQSGLVPDLTQRTMITEFPGGWEAAEWVVVDIYGFRTGPVVDAGYEDALAALRTRFVSVYARDGVLVYRSPFD